MHNKRKPLIAGNWKMNGTQAEVKTLLSGIIRGAQAFDNRVDIVVLPTFVHLFYAHQLLQQSASNLTSSATALHSPMPISIGAQNLYLGSKGAFTGEVSGAMLKEIGCEYVLIGHSERRALFTEPFDLVAAKFKAALDAGLKPILCVGETKDEREAAKTEEVVREQLASVIALVGIDAFKSAIIAYEPVWAIGTGLTATPEQAQETQNFIRQYLRQNNVDIADTIRILYGGSMKADNAEALLAMPDIDGGLIGGASLNAETFLAICAAAANAPVSEQKVG